MAVLAGTDFFSVEVLTLRGLVTYYVLFFIKLESRRVKIAGITPHPNEAWMKQIARNVTMDGWGFLEECRYLSHDRDTKFTDSFRAIIKWSDVEPLKLPARSPNLNACRALGKIRERGSVVKADTVGRDLLAACAQRIRRAFSSGA